ncbi:MAG: Asp23/Gls24 family envelope stress response protein [Atribacterota bacterium]
MELATVVTEKGKINITRITIETLIRMVLQEISGIIQPRKIGFSKIIQPSVNDNIETRKNITPEVRVEIKPDSIQINLFLTIHYGIRIPDLTWEVQAKIKEKIKEITGLDIEQINVHIQSIRFSKKYHHRRKLVAPGSFLKIF